MRLLGTWIFLSLFFVLTTNCAKAENFTGLGVFGDNISDPGNIPALINLGNQQGLPPQDANFPPSPPYFQNHYSNGLTASEQLPTLLGINPENVANLSVGNAFSGQLPVTLAGGILLGNGSSIPGPIGREIQALNNTDVQSQIRAFLANSGPLDAGDLMLVYASANDGALALNTSALLQLDVASSVQVISAGAMVNATNTIASAQMLIDAGARHVVVAALPDIGRTPAAAAGGLSGVTGATLFSDLTNVAIAEQAAALNQSSPAVVYVFDSATLSRDITENPEKYGFINADAPCLFSEQCAAAPKDAQNQLFFFDEFFPTEAGHAIAAAALADTLFAPRTIASQAEVSRISGERFGRRLLDTVSSANEQVVVTGVDIRDLERSGTLETASYESDLIRIDLGTKLPLSDSFALAAMVGFDEGSVDTENGLSSYDFFAVRLGLAANYDAELLELSASASVGFDDYSNIDRQTQVASQTVRGETEGITVPLVLEAKKSVEFDSLTVAPLARLGYTFNEVDGYTESGAPALEQIVAKRDSDTLFAEVGVRGEADFEFDDGNLKLIADGLWHSTLNDQDQNVDTALVSIPDVVRSFSVENPDESYFLVGGGLELGCKHTDIRVGVRGEAVLDSEIDGYGIRAEVILPLGAE